MSHACAGSVLQCSATVDRAKRSTWGLGQSGLASGQASPGWGQAVSEEKHFSHLVPQGSVATAAFFPTYWEIPPTSGRESQPTLVLL